MGCYFLMKFIVFALSIYSFYILKQMGFLFFFRCLIFSPTEIIPAVLLIHFMVELNIEFHVHHLAKMEFLLELLYYKRLHFIRFFIRIQVKYKNFDILKNVGESMINKIGLFCNRLRIELIKRRIILAFFYIVFFLINIKCIETPILLNKEIVFSSNRDGNYEIYSMCADGSNQTRLTDNSSADWQPDWSADGSRIVFSSQRDENFQIYVMNADGTGQTRLTNNLAEDSQPRWSPDGTKIVFTSTRDGVSNKEIYLMNADGTNQCRLTNESNDDSSPSWSPDGTKIIFNSARTGNSQIYVMNVDGSNVVRITDNVDSDTSAAWSSVGKIAYMKYKFTSYEIYTSYTFGTDHVRVTYIDGWSSNPRWSPDGKRMVFESNKDGNRELYIMNENGLISVRLTNNTWSDCYPSWKR